MKNLLWRRPTAAMIVAVGALVLALAGGAVAAGTIGLGDFTKKAKDKTVGVGKLTYATTTVALSEDDPVGGHVVTATCPTGLKVIGGGIKLADPEQDYVDDSYPTASGWKGHVFIGGSNPATTRQVTTTAICALSRVVTGAPPSS
jgi:hypothetical protein